MLGGFFLTFFHADFGKVFLPKLCGGVHPESAPLQDLRCAFCCAEQSTFRGGEQDEKVPRKGGLASRGGKKEKGACETGQK